MAKTITNPKRESDKPALVFGKINYVLMIAGIIVIAVGYLMAIGGTHTDPAVFNAQEKYSFIRITLSPMVILFGFVIEVVAIFIKAKD